jgi:hypothetical protein
MSCAVHTVCGRVTHKRRAPGLSAPKSSEFGFPAQLPSSSPPQSGGAARHVGVFHVLHVIPCIQAAIRAAKKMRERSVRVMRKSAARRELAGCDGLPYARALRAHVCPRNSDVDAGETAVTADIGSQIVLAMSSPHSYFIEQYCALSWFPVDMLFWRN